MRDERYRTIIIFCIGIYDRFPQLSSEVSSQYENSPKISGRSVQKPTSQFSKFSLDFHIVHISPSLSNIVLFLRAKVLSLIQEWCDAFILREGQLESLFKAYKELRRRKGQQGVPPCLQRVNVRSSEPFPARDETVRFQIKGNTLADRYGLQVVVHSGSVGIWMSPGISSLISETYLRVRV